MKIIQTIIHAIAFLTGISVILNIPFLKEFEGIILLLMLAYALSTLLFSVIRELSLNSFPRHIGLLLVFGFFAYEYISKRYFLFDQAGIIRNLKYATVIMAGAFIILSLIGASVKLRFKKIEINAYKKYYLVNNILYVSILLVFIPLIYFLPKSSFEESGKRMIAVLLAIFPFFNKNFVRGIALRLKNRKPFLDLGISIGQLGKLARIRNFVFAKDKIISTGDYQILESDYRSTIKVTTALQLARMLSNDWNPRYSKLFVMDEFERIKLNYRIVEKNENGISVIDDDASMYHLGNASYMKNKIRRDEHANMFLLKNEIPIAKFKINEKIAPDKTALINSLDYFGNTLLFSPGNVDDLGYDYTLLFDKIYSEIKEPKQYEMLKDLEKKAPTAFFTSKAPKQIPNSLCFHVTTNIDAEQKPNKIVLDQHQLLKVPAMVKLAKKVHTLLRYALFFSVFFQLAAAVIALLFYNQMVLVFGLSFGIALLAELFAILIIRQIGYFPSHPAILAQSHQAA